MPSIFKKGILILQKIPFLKMRIAERYFTTAYLNFQFKKATLELFIPEGQEAFAVSTKNNASCKPYCFLYHKNTSCFFKIRIVPVSEKHILSWTFHYFRTVILIAKKMKFTPQEIKIFISINTQEYESLMIMRVYEDMITLEEIPEFFKDSFIDHFQYKTVLLDDDDPSIKYYYHYDLNEWAEGLYNRYMQYMEQYPDPNAQKVYNHGWLNF